MTTLRLDVLAKEAAESIAQTLPKNNSLLHLMMGGPVPEHVLSFVAASLSANTLGRLQQPVQQQQQQRPSSTPAVSSRSPPGNARAHATQSILNRSPTRPRSAGPMGSTRPVLVRSTTQQARSLSTLDPTGVQCQIPVSSRHDGCMHPAYMHMLCCFAMCTCRSTWLTMCSSSQSGLKLFVITRDLQ